MTVHFTELVDLASERLGGKVLHANDEFFAEKENLLREAPAVWDADRYTDRGKWMDGWESRRRRTPGHDWCVVALGAPGVVRGLDVDTSFFRGNYPAECAVEAALAPAAKGWKEIAGWTPLLPRTALRGDAHNVFPVADPNVATHVRLRIFPDGGVARLRVYGDVTPDWSALGERDVDLASLANGGLVLGASDSFFGSYQKLLMPDAPSGMHDGWETKRSRRDGSDWAIVRLGTRGAVAAAELDTSHFKGNFPDRASIETCDAPGASLEALASDRVAWRELLAETKLRAHARHEFTKELLHREPATHARLRIHPDGGVARLRLFGRPAPSRWLTRLNALDSAGARAELLRACGSPRWAEAVAGARPFASHLELLAAAERAFDALAHADWLDAFSAHPRIGDRAAAATHEGAAAEQAGALSADRDVLDELARKNRAYDERFGFLFIVCASGLSAAQMLAGLDERLENPKDVELLFAADEQRKITRLRLAKALTS